MSDLLYWLHNGSHLPNTLRLSLHDPAYPLNSVCNAGGNVHHLLNTGNNSSSYCDDLLKEDDYLLNDDQLITGGYAIMRCRLYMLLLFNSKGIID